MREVAAVVKPRTLARYPVGFWFAIAVTVLGFFLLGLLFLPYLGFEYDEVMFVPMIFHPSKSLFAAPISHHFIPVMEMSYIGALKIWLYSGLFKLWRPTVYSVRLPVLVVASLTVFLVAETVRRRSSVRAAVFTGALLATDISFLLCSTFDCGPVVIQNFLLSAALYLILVHRETIFGLPLAAFALGLALWDKAIFLWILIGLVLSGFAFGFRVLRQEQTLKKLPVAAVAFAVGIAPLVVYNVKRPNQTIGGNAHFTFAEIRPKFTFVRYALNGQAFVHFFVDDSAPSHRETISTPSLPQRRSRNPSSWRFLSFALLLMAGVACARPDRRRLILWLFCAVILAWLQSVITKDAGGFVHHVVIFYPALFLAVGLAGEEIAWRFGRYGTLFLATVGVLLCGASFNTVYAQFRDFQQFSPSNFWTDADESLAQYLTAHPNRRILVADWGIATQAEVRTLCSRPIEEISFSLKDGNSTTQEAKDWAQSRSLIVLHTPNHEMFPNQRGKLAQLAKASGLAVVPVATIPDRAGHRMFEIDELSPLPAG
ncbi:MAG: hypothetical protein ACJ746_07335 [Bryobacteraceae bacterium]